MSAIQRPAIGIKAMQSLSSSPEGLVDTSCFSDCPSLDSSSSITDASLTDDNNALANDGVSRPFERLTQGRQSNMKRKLDGIVHEDSTHEDSHTTATSQQKKLKIQSSADIFPNDADLSLSPAQSPTDSMALSQSSRSSCTSITELSSLPSPSIPAAKLPDSVDRPVECPVDKLRIREKLSNQLIPEANATIVPARKYQVERIVREQEREIYCPITYVYDYLPHDISWLRPRSIGIPADIRHQLAKEPANEREQPRLNAVQLYPEDAQLPLHTGLASFRQSKHWAINFKATTELLELFAQDERCQNAKLTNGASMSTWAAKALKKNVPESVSRFAVYMFPDANEERTWLLCQIVILIFIFDDMWEHASPIVTDHIRDDFIARIEGSTSRTISDTPLQQRLTDIHDRFLKCDEEKGNAGAQAIETLVQFCKHSYPKNFTGMQDYLDYRNEDIANGYSWACAKFSIGSSVNQDDPKFARFLRLLGDQISIANDIASYDKERKEFDSGKAAHMINLVHVIIERNSLRPEVAKSMAYALQLSIESELSIEMEALRGENLSLEEWRFLDACLHAASGNLITSVIISRYGGEAAKIL